MPTTLTALSDADRQALHTALQKLFATIGFEVRDEPTLETFEKLGADVDRSAARVRLPAEVMDELIGRAPRRVLMHDMRGREIEWPGGGKPTLGSGPRRPVLEDVRRHTILAQSLPRVKLMHRMQVPAFDIPGEATYIRTMETFLSHTDKHNFTMPTSLENAELWLSLNDAACAAAGVDPESAATMTVGMGVKSPLAIKKMNVDLVRLALRRNYPVYGTVCPMSGTTAPYSVMGTILQCVAEALLVTLLVQALKPGHPSWYVAGPSISDMASGHDLYYPMEKFLIKRAVNEMGRHYGLPIIGETAGTLTWRHDVQAGFESTLMLQAAHFGALDVCQGLGSCHNANGMSPEMMLIQYEMFEGMDYLHAGVKTSELDAALESIARVGPDGDFLMDDLTLANLRSGEFLGEGLWDRSGGYVADAPSVVAKARRRVEETIEGYSPAVDGAVREAIARWARDAIAGL
jgi:trimethylamine--corrinoid protein Co-methyltransferase